MPFIPNDPSLGRNGRRNVDRVVSEMIHAQIRADGDLNYILFSYFIKSIANNQKISYGAIKNYCAELRECADIIQQAYMWPYEHDAMKRNGVIE